MLGHLFVEWVDTAAMDERLEIARGLRPVPPARRKFDQLADRWLESQA